MRSLIDINFFLSRLTLSFITAVYFVSIDSVYGFSITVPPNVTVSETTLFNYSWTSDDPLHDQHVGVFIALYDSRNRGVGTNDGKPEENNPVFLNGSEGTGQLEMAVKRTGQFYLQAFTTEFKDHKPSKSFPLVNSNVFDAVLPVPLTTTVISTFSPSSTSTTSLNPNYQSQGGPENSKDLKSLSPGAIAGIVIGILAFLLLVVAAIFVYRRRRFRQRVDAFHRERMIVAHSIPTSQVSFWTVDDRSPGESSMAATPRSFGQRFVSSSPDSGRDNNFSSQDVTRLSPLRGAGYS